ncbi:MAG: hypothetical protein KJO35_03995 [Gammaproteobacteria bacterium]|nr:hypothetical protein [Gammaproteobacteria bacterium]
MSKLHSSKVSGIRRAAGYVGVVLAAPFFIWLVVGLLPFVPSMVDVFGIPGLRWPASVTVLGLLIAAIGFWEF